MLRDWRIRCDQTLAIPMSLPLIDFAANADPASAVDASLAEIGFMQVRNIGIAPALLLDAFRASEAFFAASAATKAKSRYLSATENFGYQGLGEENLDPNAPADLKETFTMRNIVNHPPAPERWPSAAFRDVMQSLFANALEAAHGLQRIMAQALGVPSDFFTHVHTGENVTLRLLHYPASIGAALEPGQLGAGAHTDYGFLTLLFQDDVGGLQVRDCAGAWINVPPIANAIVVNSGDLLERWTNGRYRSTLHRVAPRIGARSRFSIAMFIDPDSAAEVAVLPSCTGAGNPPRFPPVTAGAHLQEKLGASHKGRFGA